MFTTHTKQLQARMDQIEGLLKNYLDNYSINLKNMEQFLQKQYQADLAAVKSDLTAQFNTVLASLQQQIQATSHNSQTLQSIVRGEAEEQDVYEALRDKRKPASGRGPGPWDFAPLSDSIPNGE